MSDDLRSYRDPDPDFGMSGGDVAGAYGRAAPRRKLGVRPEPPKARFFVRPGEMPPAEVDDRAGLSARPIQPPPRPPASEPAAVGRPATAPSRAAIQRTLRLLAFNAELRPPVAMNGRLVEGAPFADARFEELVEGLKAQDADIVVLQEIYNPSRIDRLRKVLHNRYPNVAFKKPSRDVKLGSGHVILSNRPFAELRFEPVKGALEPPGLLEKGMLLIRIALPGGGAIRLATFQGCSSGMAQREAREDTPAKRDKFARRLVRQLLDQENGEPLLLVGDLSSGPEYRPELYEQLCAAGFNDAIERADMTMRVTGRASSTAPAPPDWRPQILALTPEWSGVYFSAWRTMFDDRLVAAADGIRVPLAQRPALELLIDLEAR